MHWWVVAWVENRKGDQDKFCFYKRHVNRKIIIWLLLVYIYLQVALRCRAVRLIGLGSGDAPLLPFSRFMYHRRLALMTPLREAHSYSFLFARNFYHFYAKHFPLRITPTRLLRSRQEVAALLSSAGNGEAYEFSDRFKLESGTKLFIIHSAPTVSSPLSILHSNSLGSESAIKLARRAVYFNLKLDGSRKWFCNWSDCPVTTLYPPLSNKFYTFIENRFVCCFFKF